MQQKSNYDSQKIVQRLYASKHICSPSLIFLYENPLNANKRVIKLFIIRITLGKSGMVHGSKAGQVGNEGFAIHSSFQFSQTIVIGSRPYSFSLAFCSQRILACWFQSKLQFMWQETYGNKAICSRFKHLVISGMKFSDHKVGFLLA